MKRSTRYTLLTVGILAGITFPKEASALPGFSRQMNMDCMACHYQTMRQLNSFGRLFASSGYTMSGGPQAKSMIEGSAPGLGMPSALNASVLLKARYAKSYGKQNPSNSSYEDVGTDRGSLELFKASKVFFGGRIADNVGTLVNFNTEVWGAKAIAAFEAWNGYVGGVLFREEDSGPFSGMEYYNTGLYKPLRLFENRKSGNAAQMTGVGNGPASGGQLYYGGESLFLTVGAYIPAVGGKDGLDVGNEYIPFGRASYDFELGFGSLMLGGYLIDGKTTMTEASLNGTDPKPSTAVFVSMERQAYGLDMDFTADVWKMPLEVILQAVLKNSMTIEPDPSLLTLPDGYVNKDNSATSLEFQLTPWPEVAFRGSYMRYLVKVPASPSDASETSYSGGVDYIFRQNILAGLEYTYHNYDNPDDDNYQELYLELTMAF
jgi:hypothetical protein